MPATNATIPARRRRAFHSRSGSFLCSCTTMRDSFPDVLAPAHVARSVGAVEGARLATTRQRPGRRAARRVDVQSDGAAEVIRASCPARRCPPEPVRGRGVRLCVRTTRTGACAQKPLLVSAMRSRDDAGRVDETVGLRPRVNPSHLRPVVRTWPAVSVRCRVREVASVFTPPTASAAERGFRPRLGPHGLLRRRRTVPDAEREAVAETGALAPRLRVPEPPHSPLPAALLPLPEGFELNRPGSASVVPPQAASDRLRSGASAI